MKRTDKKANASVFVDFFCGSGHLPLVITHASVHGNSLVCVALMPKRMLVCSKCFICTVGDFWIVFVITLYTLSAFYRENRQPKCMCHTSHTVDLVHSFFWLHAYGHVETYEQEDYDGLAAFQRVCWFLFLWFACRRKTCWFQKWKHFCYRKCPSFEHIYASKLFCHTAINTCFHYAQVLCKQCLDAWLCHLLQGVKRPTIKHFEGYFQPLIGVSDFKILIF